MTRLTRAVQLPISFVALTVLALAAPAGARADNQGTFPPEVKVLSPAQLEQMLKAKDFFLVNVHIPYAGEIPQTDSFIPYNETRSRASDYPKDKNARIVIYCLTSYMAGIAVKDLVSMGFTDVSILDGGMKAWKQAGLTLLDRGNAPGVPYPGASDKSSTDPLPQGCPCSAE